MAVQPDRRLVPIVSLDVVGYSRLTELNERQALRLVQRVYDRLVARTIGRQGGKVFKTMGDGLLAEFQSVVAAVEWVAELQRELRERQLRVPGGGFLQIRAGVVLADVLVAGDDLYGSGVNLSVRVQALSPPGGMAITKWMYQYLDGRTDLQFVDLGPTELKNVSRTVRLYVWHPDGIAPNAPARAAAEPVETARSSRPSVVVLPFDNLSGEADQGYFADAVVEEITATLSRIRDFFVIARNSAFAYKGRALDIRQLGKELGVRYAVEGSVRRVGERVRITTQLVETDSGNHVWSTKVDGAVSDLFDLQDRVAAEVASAIQPSIRRVEVARARSKRPDTMAAYDMVMRALPHLWAHRMDENLQAIAYLDKALQLEPDCALAAAFCSWAHGQQVAYTWATDVIAERREGERLIELAARSGDDDPTALTAVASAMMLLGGDVRQAANFAERALKLDPNHAWAWMRLAYGLVYLGQAVEALKAFEQSARLSPLDPFAFNVHLGMGLAHFSAGRPEKAIEMARQALAERPGLTWPYRDLATYYSVAGKLEQARDALRKFVHQRPAMTVATLRDSLRFMEPPLLDRYIDGLEQAGLTQVNDR